MRAMLWGAGLALLLTGCGGAEGMAGAGAREALVVRSGTSFGMCVGYCATTVEVGSGEMVLTQTSREPDRYPTRTVRAPISAAEWAEVVALVDAVEWGGLLDTYGCPDCADGGAEWVEVARDGRTQRVTFEHGAAVEGMQPLVEKLREIRRRMVPE